MTKCIRIKDIQNFLNSNIGKRMQKAAKSKLLKTEQPFVLGVDAGEIYREEIKDACQTAIGRYVPERSRGCLSIRYEE